MRRGTTPTVTLTLEGFNPSDLKAILITFSQSELLLEKNEQSAGVIIEGNAIKVKLTQEETLAMSAAEKLYVQIRGLADNGEAFATDVVTFEVLDVLSDGVIA